MKKIVEIEWDEPQDDNWLCAANIEVALTEYCTNTNFKVTEVKTSTDSVTKPMPRYIISFTGVVGRERILCNTDYTGIIKSLESLVETLKKEVKIESCNDAHPDKVHITSILFKIED